MTLLRRRFVADEKRFDPDGQNAVWEPPAGEYRLKLVKSDQSKYDKKIHINRFEILDGPDPSINGKFLIQRLHWYKESGASDGAVRYADGKMAQICDTMNIDGFDDTDELVGSELGCSVDLESFGDDGKTSIKFDVFYPASNYKPRRKTGAESSQTANTSAPASNSVADDDIPF